MSEKATPSQAHPHIREMSIQGSQNVLYPLFLNGSHLIPWNHLSLPGVSYPLQRIPHPAQCPNSVAL